MLQKGFLRNQNIFQISKKQIWISFLLGMFASGCFFLFLSLLNLLFRFLSFVNGNGPAIVSQDISYWQQFNFALIGVTLGNSIFLGSLFKKPSKNTLKNYKRLTIINDQTYFGFTFWFIFTKFFLAIGVLSIAGFDTKFLPTYTSVFVLIALVIFLENWKTINLIFRRKAMKIMMVNAVILTTIAFILPLTTTSINSMADKILLQNNPIIELPVTNYESKGGYRWLGFVKVIPENGGYSYLINEERVEASQLHIALGKMRSHHYRGEYIKFYIPYDAPMEQINFIDRTCYYLQIYKVWWITQRPKGQITGRFDTRGVLKRNFFSEETMMKFVKEEHNNKVPPSPPPSRFLQEISSDSIIEVDILNNIVVDGVELDEKLLNEVFSNAIQNKMFVNFKYREDLEFQEFLTVFSIYLTAVNELQDEHRLIPSPEDYYYEKDLRNKFEDDDRRVKSLFPLKYLENYSVLDSLQIRNNSN